MILISDWKFLRDDLAVYRKVIYRVGKVENIKANKASQGRGLLLLRSVSASVGHMIVLTNHGVTEA